PAGKVWFLTLQDEEYPQLLKEIKNPPFVLYGKGDRELLARRPHVSDDALTIRGPAASLPATPLKEANSFVRSVSARSIFSGKPSAGELRADGNPSSGVTPYSTIAVVGARKTTEYGREVTKLLTEELVANGFTIVSGLALGVDAIAHATALENNGKTIAVLGCGVDCCSPEENRDLYNSIIEKKGCIVSEFPLGMSPSYWTFPARNRIIAGLSQAVLVTEGAEYSGSLITANFALKYGRKVFAVPGPITSQMSKGPLSLIAKGAKLVTSARDILEELKIQNVKVKSASQKLKIKGDTEEEDTILKLLENEPLHFDELVRRSKFNSSKLSSTLSLMEIKGMLISLDNGCFGIIY
ncbi:MAG: DNA-processing protein DprA, partial [Candidatus Levybacteria bacterium]|nr:DNA-processing protein DprA [Candidatus Levybacteria bacterium]